MGYHVHYPPIDEFFCQMHMDIILPIWDFTSNYIDTLFAPYVILVESTWGHYSPILFRYQKLYVELYLNIDLHFKVHMDMILPSRFSWKKT